MRLLAACSLGGAGHLRPLAPFRDAARWRGDETLVVGPPALADMVAGTVVVGDDAAAITAAIDSALAASSHREAAGRIAAEMAAAPPPDEVLARLGRHGLSSLDALVAPASEPLALRR